LQPDGTYKDKNDVSYTYNASTGQFQKAAKAGGLIQAAIGGSTSDLVMNDAMGGNTYTFTQ
jgi:hypothetical protein